MDSRERTFRALDHKAADRLPVDFWASAAMVRILEASQGISYDAFLDRHDVDLRYIAGPTYVGPPLDGGEDIWGVTRRAVEAPMRQGAERYQEVAVSPLAGAATIEDIQQYPRWPNPDWFDYSVIPSQCDAILAQNRVVVFMGDRLNRVAQLKPAMYLRGMESIFLDLAMRPAIAEGIFGGIRRFYMAYLERILDAANGKIDIVLTGDDFGSQNGLLVSPAMWRRFLRPGFAEYIGLIRSRGSRAMHHTCGAVGEIIPDLIDCGLDILQSLQPEAAGMSLGRLIDDFGGELCFHGGVSVERTMPFGSPGDIRNEVRRIADLTLPRGGYICCTSHNIQADTPVENVLALLSAYREFGVT